MASQVEEEVEDLVESGERTRRKGPAAEGEGEEPSESIEETDRLVVAAPSSSSTNFLQKQKSQIYTARDFANKTLSTRQKVAVLVGIVLLCFIIKAFAIDPFRVDKQKWEAQKAFVDEVVKEEVRKNPELLAGSTKRWSILKE